MAVAAVLEPERALAARVLEGDDLAFRQLYRRHTPRLFALVSRLVGGREADAEDAVQDTWFKATERLGDFRWECAFGTWLCAIGVNVVKEQARRRMRRPETDWPEDHDPPQATPLDRVEPMDLDRAITALPAVNDCQSSSQARAHTRKSPAARLLLIKWTIGWSARS